MYPLCKYSYMQEVHVQLFQVGVATSKYRYMYMYMYIEISSPYVHVHVCVQKVDFLAFEVKNI